MYESNPICPMISKADSAPVRCVEYGCAWFVDGACAAALIAEHLAEQREDV